MNGLVKPNGHSLYVNKIHIKNTTDIATDLESIEIKILYLYGVLQSHVLREVGQCGLQIYCSGTQSLHVIQYLKASMM